LPNVQPVRALGGHWKKCYERATLRFSSPPSVAPPPSTRNSPAGFEHLREQLNADLQRPFANVRFGSRAAIARARRRATWRRRRSSVSLGACGRFNDVIRPSVMSAENPCRASQTRSLVRAPQDLPPAFFNAPTWPQRAVTQIGSFAKLSLAPGQVWTSWPLADFFLERSIPGGGAAVDVRG
jgi:hypothetical protein